MTNDGRAAAFAGVDHHREPCPDRILDDIGGAFSMGAVGGGLFHAGKQMIWGPKRYKTRSALEVRALALSLALSLSLSRSHSDASPPLDSSRQTQFLGLDRRRSPLARMEAFDPTAHGPSENVCVAARRRSGGSLQGWAAVSPSGVASSPASTALWCICGRRRTHGILSRPER